jgi:hypothetical protein
MKNGSNKNGKNRNDSKDDDTKARRFGDSNVPLTGEQQRSLCFNLFNDYWRDAAKQGVEFDVVGTMSISAALFGIVSKHGKESVVQFIGDLAKSVENNEYTFLQS